MTALAIDEISLLLAVIAIGLAIRKWHIIRDRHMVLSVVKIALKERKAFWIGTLLGVFYLAVFMILGGKGGRIHVLFGRLIFTTTPAEVLAGIALAFLVTISMALFVYGVHVMGLAQSGKKSAVGLLGSLLAILASFCP